MNRLIVAVLAAACLGACVQKLPEETDQDLIERGEYLVLNVAGCNDCHTPMTRQGPDMSRGLQGATLIFGPEIEMPWAPVAPPIAGIPQHYTEEQFTHFLQTGVRPDGSHTRPPMPAYRLNEADARAVTAYIKSLPRDE